MRYRVADADRADDLTAQVFERALVGIHSYQLERGSFAAWLFAIARNAVSDWLRSQRSRRSLSLQTLRWWASPEPRPEDIVTANETHAQLLAAVGCLSDREGDLIALKFAAGLTNRRIAELTGLSASNVGVILYRAVRRLRAELSTRE